IDVAAPVRGRHGLPPTGVVTQAPPAPAAPPPAVTATATAVERRALQRYALRRRAPALRRLPDQPRPDVPPADQWWRRNARSAGKRRLRKLRRRAGDVPG